MSETQIVAATRVAELRNDLKRWEKLFAEQNGGRKAGRDDIKAHVDIGKRVERSGIMQTIMRSLMRQSQPPNTRSITTFAT